MRDMQAYVVTFLFLFLLLLSWGYFFFTVNTPSVFTWLSVIATPSYILHYASAGHKAMYAFVYDTFLLEAAQFTEPCELRMLADSFRPDGYALALRKNSPHTDVVQRAIVDLREAGILHNMKNIWVSGPCADAAYTSKSHCVHVWLHSISSVHFPPT